MSEKLTQFLNSISNQNISDIKLEYSPKLKILIIIEDHQKLIIIDNVPEDPKKRVELKLKQNVIKTILHPKNENQLLIITPESIYLIPNLKKFSKENEIMKINLIPEKIISIKFSFFDSCFGVLFNDKTFRYYYLSKEKKFEEICQIKDIEGDYVDFTFCPTFSRGFEIFMIYFLTKNGTLDIYGPFFPTEFYIPKEFFFNMENYLLYKISLLGNSNKDKAAIYSLSLKVIDDLKNSIIPRDDIYNDYVRISDKMKKFNSVFRKR